MESAERAVGSSPEPGGIYVHLPFCSAICPYCDFAVTVGGRDRRRQVVDAILKEIDAGRGPGVPIDTIYFGGGTPSLHQPEQIAEIATAIRERYESSVEPRIFLEANPEDVTPGHLEQWVALGVRTLSLGVQALDDESLRFLGRRHTAEEGLRSVELARASGIETLSVDLIYARPGQAAAAWRAELEQAAGLDPDHLSCYQLTVHRGTRFGRWHRQGRFELPPEPDQEELFVTTFRVLEDLGFEAYEVSNFARGREHRSRHNLKYWTGAPYVGFGPSAHSFDGRRRWWNVRLTHRYLERIAKGRTAVEEVESLTPEQRVLEQLMLGLRRPEGVDIGELERRYDLALLEPNRDVVEQWMKVGWVVVEGERVRPTLAGLLVADRLPGDIRLES
jgi:oxygen-independent coproporphyrinogen-3 oxidase